MRECELCGKESVLEKIKIEDTVLNVCKKCSCLGTKIEERELVKTQQTQAKIEISELVPDFPAKIKEAREKAGFSRTDLAQKIGVSASLVTRIEKGMRPTDKVVKKLEKELKITLFYKETITSIKTERVPEVTLGDVVQLRLKKK